MTHPTTEQRELLELAAKAAGYDTHGYDMLGEGGVWACEKGAEPFDGELPIFAWMPLTDDGDALRLAVKLGLLIDVDGNSTDAGSFGAHGYHTEPHDADPYAATRRAIVRAAAAIAKGEK